MRLLVILAVGFLAVNASAFNETDSRLHGENGWYVPAEDDSFYWLDKERAEYYLETMENVQPRDLSLTPVDFYMYTNDNRKKGKKFTDSTKSIKAANFNPLLPTRFVIHGFTKGGDSSVSKDIRNAFLNKGNYNVIVVDWGRARVPEYASAVLAVPKVGQKVANMIDTLVKHHDMFLETLHIIGHSLGAHIAGYAGKNIKTGQIHTIYGLDPALPLFSYDKPAKRLNSDDAFYVETIQTNGGKLGFLLPIGKASFYPNGGKSQPGCLTDICSHERAIAYFAESVTLDDFAAIECKSTADALVNNCGTTYSSLRMGADNNEDMIGGNFYVPVNKKTPFGVLH